MRFPWRDGLATLFVAAALGLYAAFELDRPVPGFSTVATVAIAVLVLGIIASASAVVPGFMELLRGSRLYMVVTSVLGIVALGGGIWALVGDEQNGLRALVAATLVLWAVSTLRHLAVPATREGLGHR